MAIPSSTEFPTRLPSVEYFVHVQVPSASVLLLNTTPITLVAADANYALIPRRCHFHKPASSAAYTIVGITQIAIRVGTTAECGPGAAGLLDSTAETHVMMLGPGSAAALFSGFDVKALGGLSLNLFSAGANPAAGNAPLDIGLFYLKVPIGFTG